MLGKPSKRTDKIVRNQSFIDRRNFVRLDKNESPYFISEGILEDIKKSLDLELISRYQNLDPIYESIAKYFQVRSSELLLTAGADAGIKTAYEAFTDSGDKILVPLNAYGMHQVYQKLFDVETYEFDFHASNAYEKLIDVIRKEKIRLVFLENPTGSTGEWIKPLNIFEIAKMLRECGSQLAIDETYTGISVPGLELNKTVLLDNVIVIRSFSKLFGLAGLRAGALIASKQSIEVMRKPKPMHEISSIAAIAVKVVLESPLHLQESRKLFDSEVSRIQELIPRDNFMTYFGKANFYLAKPTKGFSQSLPVFLAEQGILIKEPLSQGRFQDFCRISIGTQSENSKLIEALCLYVQQRR